MNLLLIVVTSLLWIWQWLPVHKAGRAWQEKLVLHGLYGSALAMNIIYAQKWIEPVLMRPYITLLQMVNRALGMG
ncbi:hypothetical protein R70723_12340 [Paenibacillus sp. FSL R7-0273]|uniref:hypothetical protein n=1 Tax=Paenibacillus sp. FSL R7-0273 TaxID=1536772 RepID=UPI0004F78218|nr:hypothetical protein [Paenibacillus sp. FSL R7-0273]AIQ46573.1 hypothetical protein R70723_12340 [Paenibacillus sp. FSL R7-0273]OMF97660.1 hypothetical protein BK144_03230 [Paenibacillus sp. FSL R7-0273]